MAIRKQKVLIYRMRDDLMKKIKILMLIVVLFILVAPYLRVELLTHLYKNDFAEIDTSQFMIYKMEYFKIYKYTKNKAVIFFVEEDKAYSVLVYFTRNDDGEWMFTGEWKCIWSKYGSASEFIWPYYR